MLKGLIYTMTGIIAMSSITYAMKAKRILNGAGFYCEVERTPKNLSSGCGYSIRVKGDIEKIIGILKNNGINYKDYITLAS